MSYAPLESSDIYGVAQSLLVTPPNLETTVRRIVVVSPSHDAAATQALFVSLCSDDPEMGYVSVMERLFPNAGDEKYSAAHALKNDCGFEYDIVTYDEFTDGMDLNGIPGITSREYMAYTLTLIHIAFKSLPRTPRDLVYLKDHLFKRYKAYMHIYQQTPTRQRFDALYPDDMVSSLSLMLQGADNFRRVTHQRLRSLINAPNTQHKSLAQGFCIVVSEYAMSDFMRCVNELIVPNSPILYDSRVLAETLRLAAAYRAGLEAGKEVSIQRILRGTRETAVYNRSNFPTLADVATIKAQERTRSIERVNGYVEENERSDFLRSLLAIDMGRDAVALANNSRFRTITSSIFEFA